MRNRNLRALNLVGLVVSVAMLMSASGAGPQTNYKTLYKFGFGQGGEVLGAGLISDAAGNLYGTTEQGGVGQGLGTIFELTPNSGGGWKEKVLHSFCATDCSDGYQPQAGLIFDAAGNLYGTTRVGGKCVDSCGAVFKLMPNSGGNWTLKVLYDFTGGPDGSEPLAGLTFDTAGNLYGTTIFGGNTGCDHLSGCGVVFQLKPNSDGGWTESVLHTFTGSDGEYPRSGVILDAAGTLYGTTSGGGASDGGTVFQLSPTGAETVLHSFTVSNLADGYIPAAGLIWDANGNLYGTTSQGGNVVDRCNGATGCGIVFELKPTSGGGWKESVLYRFCSAATCADGKWPVASVTFDSSGNLYGTTSAGGAVVQAGVVFELTPGLKGGWSERVLHRFLDRPGYAPMAGVIFDAAGNLYGTTLGDGLPGGTFGSVFEIAP
jgi:uncharacterized repeat protein (TIGR03803 family)